MATLGTVSYGLQLNGVRKFVGGTQTATKGIASFNKGLVVATASIGAIGFALKHLADASGKFSEGLAAVGAVTKATASDMDMLKRAAIQAGIATQFSPTEAVDGLLALSTAGQTATQATKTLIPVLNLAAGSLGQLSTAEAGMAIVGTMNTYGMAADKAGEVTDKLLRITQLTNFQTRDFSAGLAKAAAKSTVFGQSLDDTLIVMGLLRNANIDASSAATAYTMAVQRVATDTKALNTMQKLGVSLYDKQTGKTRAFMDLITELKPKIEGLSDATRNKALKDMFGARAITAYNAIAKAQVTVTRDGTQVVLKGADAIEHLRNNVASATGVSKEFTGALLDTYEGQKKLLAGSISTLKVVAGDEFANAFKPFISNAIGGINDLIATLQAMTPEAKRQLVEQTLEWVELAAKIVAATFVITKMIPVVMALHKAFVMMAAAQAAVKAGGFAQAMSTWYTKSGPLVKGLGSIARGLISVKLGALAAGAALVYAANKSYNAIVKQKDQAAMIVKMQSGKATAADFQKQRVGKSAKGNIGEDIFERRVGATGTNKRIGGTMTAIATKPMELAGKTIEQVQTQLLKLDGLQKRMINASESGQGFSIFGNITDEAGKVVRVVSITATDIERRIKKVRTALNSLILSDYEAEVPGGADASPKLDKATEAALSGASAGASTMTAMGTPLSYIEEVARLEAEQQEDRKAREKKIADARLRLQDQLRASQEGMAEAIRKRDADALAAAKAVAKVKVDAAKAAAKADADAVKAQRKELQRKETQAGQVSGLAGSALQADFGGMAVASSALAGAPLDPLTKAAAMLADKFIGMSVEGAKFKESFSELFEILAQALNPIFRPLNTLMEAIKPLIEVITRANAMFNDVIMAQLKPALWLLGKVLTAAAIIIANIIIAFRAMYLEILYFVDWMTGGLSGLSESIDELEKVQATEVRQRNELIHGIDKQKEATDAATRSMLNIPSGVKIAAKRFAAANAEPGGRTHNDFIQRPGQAATSFSPDDTVIGVKDTDSLGGGSGSIILQNVHINANDPTAFFRNLLDLVNRDHKRGGQALGGMFQGRP